jgi:hypothetical protein
MGTEAIKIVGFTKWQHQFIDGNTDETANVKQKGML